MRTPIARLTAVTLLALLSVGLLSQSASAKGEIRATLDQPLPSTAAPGTRLPVAWKLEARDARTKKYVPFGAGGVFVRLIGTNPMQSTEQVVEGNGSFSATVTVPPGGIKKVQIGFKAMQASHGGVDQPDYFIPIAGQSIETPPVVLDNTWSSSMWLLLVGLIGAALIALAIIFRRRDGRAGYSPVGA
jgi:hypothetical protein